MYCVTVTEDLEFTEDYISFIYKGDNLTMCEDLELGDGDLVYFQSQNKTGIGVYSDFMQLKEGVTAHAIVNINRPIKDDEATRQARLKRCGL